MYDWLFTYIYIQENLLVVVHREQPFTLSVRKLRLQIKVRLQLKRYNLHISKPISLPAVRPYNMALRSNGQRVPRNKYWRSNAKITDEQRRWKNQTQEPVEQKSQRKLGDKEKRSSSKRENILTMQQEKRETVAPFMMRGTINNKSFEAMIDSGSPVTIFPKKELKEILKVQFLFVTKMPKHEKYVDYNGSQLDLLGVLKGRVEVQGKTIGQARILVSKDGAKAIVGRDWMRQLEYKIQPESERKNNENSILRVDKSTVRKVEKTEKSMDLQQLEEKFPKLFSRRGKFKGIRIKANFTKEMKPTKQRGRRIPLKHQGSVMNEKSDYKRRRAYQKSGRDQRKCFHPTNSNNSKEGWKCKNRCRRKTIKQLHHKGQISNAKC